MKFGQSANLSELFVVPIRSHSALICKADCVGAVFERNLRHNYYEQTRRLKFLKIRYYRLAEQGISNAGGAMICRHEKNIFFAAVKPQCTEGYNAESSILKTYYI